MMKKKIVLSLLLVAFCAFFQASSQQLKNQQNAKDDLQSRMLGDPNEDHLKREYLLSKNPTTDEIPKNIQKKALKRAKKQLKRYSNKSNTETTAATIDPWVNRGPYDVGGRTRAIAIDVSNENIILAGGVSGGLWRSEDGGKSWEKVTRKFQTPLITAIAQDPRPGQQHIWYYGGGEVRGTTLLGSDGRVLYKDNGIFKSQDGGRTWELLKNTSDNSSDTLSPFDIIDRIIINPSNGQLYIATHEGIYKSNNQGKSFEIVLENENSFNKYYKTLESDILIIPRANERPTITDLVLTKDGTFYAAMGSYEDKANHGIFTSKDGENWKNISPEDYPDIVIRTVLASSPSNPNEIYVLTETAPGGPPSFLSPNKLWRLDADQDQWTNLSANLPNQLPITFSLKFQSGYDMLLKVHPSNSDIIFVGGTNLYRSMDGFRTPLGIEGLIGGYTDRPLGPDEPINYTNHHPDQHALVFFPSNPNKALSGCDGGVFVTNDITQTQSSIAEEPVVWTSLNRGYTTTQAYHVSFDPNGSGSEIIAGFQDNSTWGTYSNDTKKSWKFLSPADGSYSAIADNGNTQYVSRQYGIVFRQNLDANKKIISRTFVSAPGQKTFVNPFILDSKNDNMMYMPVTNVLWRNSNLDDILPNRSSGSKNNWKELESTLITESPQGSDFRISALDVSTYPEANKLYYGTSDGRIFVLNNANLSGQSPIDISIDKGLPKNAYVSSIQVDPSNSDRVLLAYSNYGIPSIFLTEDAGENWSDISGNLEQRKNGSGNGPSIRSVAFVGSNNGFIAATSVGVYYADRILGENTYWKPEANDLGLLFANVVKSRKDGYTILGTYGNGIYSKKYKVNPRPESTLHIKRYEENLIVEKEETRLEIALDALFASTTNSPIEFKVESLNTDYANATIKDNIVLIDFVNNEYRSQTAISIIAKSGKEQVAQEFTITTVAPPLLYAQMEFEKDLTALSFYRGLNDLEVFSADDFVIPAGAQWRVDEVAARGFSFGPVATTNVSIYKNSGNTPGDLVYEGKQLDFILSPTNDNFIIIKLPESIVLDSGHYWLSIRPDTSNGFNNIWLWSGTSTITNNYTYMKDPLGYNGSPSEEWQPASRTVISGFIGIPSNLSDRTFQIFGQKTDGTAPKTNNSDIAQTLTVFPNPSADVFQFQFSSKLENAKLVIVNTTGQTVFETTLTNTAVSEWNASQLPSGFYFASVIGNKTSKQVKLFKK